MNSINRKTSVHTKSATNSLKIKYKIDNKLKQKNPDTVSERYLLPHQASDNKVGDTLKY